jgi:hypothetical protein
MKNNLSNILHGHAESNEGANLRIYKTLEISIEVVHLRQVLEAHVCWSGGSQATPTKFSNNHLNGSD